MAPVFRRRLAVWLTACPVALALVACGRWGFDALMPCPEGAECDRRTDFDPANPGGADAGLWPGASGEGGLAPGFPPDGSSDGASDGTSERPPGSGPGCGSLQLLQEDFDDGETNNAWVLRYFNGAQAELTNDRLELRVVRGGSEAEASYRSPTSYDLRNSEISVEVPRVGGRITGLELREGVLEKFEPPFSPLAPGVALVVEEGLLGAVTFDGAGTTTRASVPYDADAHRYWRLREQAGQVHWETSPDRASWSTLHAEAVEMDTAHVGPGFYVQSSVADANEAWFDNLNLPAADVPGRCAASDLRDDFEDDVIAPVWKRWVGAGTCTVRETNGQVELTFPADEVSLCGLVTSGEIAFRDSAISFELVSVPDDPSFATFVDLISHRRELPFMSRIEVRIVAGVAAMRIMRKPTPEENETEVFAASLTFDPVAHRFWRLRESGGRTYWETSPSGEGWQTRAETETQVVDPAEMVFGLSGQRYAGASGPTPVVRYDRVNR